MQKEILAWTKTVEIPPAASGISPEACLIMMIYSISSQLSSDIEIYQEGEEKIWVSFGYSTFDSEMIFQGYGISAALVSQKYHVSVYGNTDKSETVLLKAFFSEDGRKLVMEKHSISGKNFEEFYNLSLCITWEGENRKDFLQVIAGLRHDRGILVVKRTAYTERIFEKTEQLDGHTYYQYIVLNEAAELEDGLLELSIPQIKKLWLVFLEDEAEIPEFSYALEAIRRKDFPGAFAWELALHLAMDETGVRIVHDRDGFHILGKEGKTMRYTYEVKSPGQKLFLKLLFPVPVRMS